MILADTSVWVDHLRRGDARLANLLADGRVLGHPAVIGEIGLGSLANRREVLRLLADLPQAIQATHAEVLTYVETHKLSGIGIGYVDAHLLASTALTADASLWTRDKRLRTAALKTMHAQPVDAGRRPASRSRVTGRPSDGRVDLQSAHRDLHGKAHRV